MTATPTLQNVLFTAMTPERNSTNHIALYDLAPRFVSYTENSPDTPYLQAIQRKFVYREQRYRVTVTPARLVNADGTNTEAFPGEFEQLVEEVIRGIAIRQKKMRTTADNEVQTSFTVYAVRKDLARYGHSASKEEVKRALFILNRCSIEITIDDTDEPVDGKRRRRKPLVSAPAFTSLKFRDENDPESETLVQFNPFVADAIRTLDFYPVHYETIMKLKGSLARWILKSISLQLISDDSHSLDTGLMTLNASEVIDAYGLSYSRQRKALARIADSIESLKKERVIERYVASDVFEGKRKADIAFHIVFTKEFLEERRAAHRLTHRIQDIGRAKVAGRGTFIPLSRAEEAELQQDLFGHGLV